MYVCICVCMPARVYVTYNLVCVCFIHKNINRGECGPLGSVEIDLGPLASGTQNLICQRIRMFRFRHSHKTA